MEIYHRITDQIAVVFFEPRLSMDEVDEFKAHVLPLIENLEIMGLLLDLSNVEFIDSSGFGTLISIFKKLQQNKKKLALCQMNEEVREIFKILSLDRKIRLFTSEEEAMKYFQE
ncbi:MAG: STAS domain-containing protein [SAR324 cluster bacterium]|nr:STAS domain-containing protein [SAR324 cluster bacterium]